MSRYIIAASCAAGEIGIGLLGLTLLSTHTLDNLFSPHSLAVKMLSKEASQQIVKNHRLFNIQFEWDIALDEIGDLFVVVIEHLADDEFSFEEVYFTSACRMKLHH